MVIVSVVTNPVTNNMIFWLRSDTQVNTNSSGYVLSWGDKSGLVRPAWQTNTNYRPLCITNSYKTTPGLFFDGTNDYLIISNNAAINTATITNRMLAMSFRTGTNIVSRQVLYEQGGTNSGLNAYIWNSNLYMNVWSTNWGPVWLTNAVARDAQYVMRFVFAQPSNRIEGFLNGTSIGLTNCPGLLAGSTDGVAIAGIRGTTRFHGGDGVSP